ncbi:MAG TPA: response regulator transcription factor [Terriglobales bacterium]|nr:response regulator transcription factor [Terriglobales bacterium]
MGKSDKIRVLVADDHAILRTGLRMLIDAQPDMAVVGEAHDGNQAVELARENKPDVVLLDVTMPVSGGLHAIAEIIRQNPQARVLLLTMHAEIAYLRTALATGAAGYVLKKSVDADLLSAIRTVHRGLKYVDSELASGLLQEMVGNGTGSTQEGGGASKILSERELQVLKLVAEGFSSREIASRIYVSTKTVETYRGRFAEKLGLKTRADVVQYALNIGLLSAEKFSFSKRPSNSFLSARSKLSSGKTTRKK